MIDELDHNRLLRGKACNERALVWSLPGLQRPSRSCSSPDGWPTPSLHPRRPLRPMLRWRRRRRRSWPCRSQPAKRRRTRWSGSDSTMAWSTATSAGERATRFSPTRRASRRLKTARCRRPKSRRCSPAPRRRVTQSGFRSSRTPRRERRSARQPSSSAPAPERSSTWPRARTPISTPSTRASPP